MVTNVRVSVVVGDLPNAVPFIDTNIRRVLHRVFVGPDVPEPAAKEPALLAIAEKLVPSEGNAAWTWNQAVVAFRKRTFRRVALPRSAGRRWKPPRTLWVGTHGFNLRALAALPGRSTSDRSPIVSA